MTAPLHRLSNVGLVHKGWPALVALAAVFALLRPPPAHEQMVSRDEKHRGVAYAHEWRHAERFGYGTSASAASLRRLKELGVTWIAITPFAFQATPQDATIHWGARVGESDDRLRRVTEQAHVLGIRVMVKPHVWLRPPHWVGLVEPRTEADWGAWFREYGAFVLDYARVARAIGAEALCVGNELRQTTHREQEWRALIRAVRRAYDGPLTYGANGDEVYRVGFWDALDFIGMSAYFPLHEARAPSRAALREAWQPIIDRLAALAARWRRPVLFTELGYRSADFAAWKQWLIPVAAPVNVAAQANAYAAFFEAVWLQPWLAGVYWWKWCSCLEAGKLEDDYTPRGKPAELVLARYYQANGRR